MARRRPRARSSEDLMSSGTTRNQVKSRSQVSSTWPALLASRDQDPPGAPAYRDAPAQARSGGAIPTSSGHRAWSRHRAARALEDGGSASSRGHLGDDRPRHRRSIVLQQHVETRAQIPRKKSIQTEESTRRRSPFAGARTLEVDSRVDFARHGLAAARSALRMSSVSPARTVSRLL